MSELVAVLVGVVAATVAQWFITPGVERRVRAHERWELDVLRLGEGLSRDLPRLRSAAWGSFAMWKLIHDHAAEEGVDLASDARLSSMLREEEATAREVTAELREFQSVRLRWLLKRVEAGLDDGSLLSMAWRRWELQTTYVVPSFVWEVDKRDELEKRWDEEQNAAAELRRMIEDLAAGIAPAPGMRLRVGRIRRRLRRKPKPLGS